jgi:hypothetical protein
LAGIDLDLDPTTHEWIRIDGKMTTDMPDANIGFASIETEHHGNILWVKLDRDTHRVGFALTPALLAKYPNGITQDEALKEAAEGMKPFKLEVDRLDWWTHYKYVEKSQSLRISESDISLTCMLPGSSRASHRFCKRTNLSSSEVMPPILIPLALLRA